MANRVSVDIGIVTSDKFLKLPMSARVIYYHLLFSANGKGVVNKLNTICRLLDLTKDASVPLFDAGYLTRISEYEVLVNHWMEHKITSERKNRNTHFYRKWRAEVIARDGSCTSCSSKNKLVAHHIKPFVAFPELRIELSNGITLCDKCHKKLHKEERRRK